MNANIEVAIEVLQKIGKPMSPNHIYAAAKELGIDDRITYGGNTPEATFSAHLYALSKHKPEKSPFKVVSKKPTLITLKDPSFLEQLYAEESPKKRNKASNSNIGKEWETIEKNDSSEANNCATIDGDLESFNKNGLEAFEDLKQHRREPSFLEIDLHPLLAFFVKDSPNFKAYSKTINHQSSTKGTRGEGIWTHPDMVGVNFSYEGYEEIINEFMKEYYRRPIKIFSFEIKRELTVGNLRECYFQAVSNSSWANEAYLVAPNINENNQELISLIKGLNTSFGVGVISLNPANIKNSKIIAFAKTREDLDFNIIDGLAKKSPDFLKFFETVKDYKSKKSERFSDEFDPVLSEEKLKQHIFDKKILDLKKHTTN